jgi:hypothetical protein
MAVPAVATKETVAVVQGRVSVRSRRASRGHSRLVAVHVHPILNPFFMAMAAGAMIVVSLFELVPLANTYGGMGWFLLGLAGTVPWSSWPYRVSCRSEIECRHPGYFVPHERQPCAA